MQPAQKNDMKTGGLHKGLPGRISLSIRLTPILKTDVNNHLIRFVHFASFRCVLRLHWPSVSIHYCDILYLDHHRPSPQAQPLVTSDTSPPHPIIFALALLSSFLPSPARRRKRGFQRGNAPLAGVLYHLANKGTLI